MGTEEAWHRVCRSAVPIPSAREFFESFGVTKRNATWQIRLDEDWRVVMQPDEGDLALLVSDVLCVPAAQGLDATVGRGAIVEELTRQVALLTVSRVRGVPLPDDWGPVRDTVITVLTQAVVVVPAGGLYSGGLEEDEGAGIAEVGEHVIAGHLDDAFARGVERFARSNGLPGFRFTNDSWWAEDLVDALSDPGIGPEILEGYETNGSWPWFVFACSVPAVGDAADAAAAAVARALLGALVLFDHLPGYYWSEVVPWLPGELASVEDPRTPSTFDSDNLISLAPQRMDRQSRRLEHAESSEGGRFPCEIDAWQHFTGVAGPFFTAVAEDALTGTFGGTGLSDACRFAWHAAASNDPDVRLALVSAAARLVLAGRGREATDALFSRLTQAGLAWRLRLEDQWPKNQRSLLGTEWSRDVWAGRLLSWEAIQRPSTSYAPSWGARSAEVSHRALHSLQALTFGVAGELTP